MQTISEKPDIFDIFVVIPREVTPVALEKLRKSIQHEVDAVLREVGTPRELKWIIKLDVKIPHFSLNMPLRLDVGGRAITINIR
ncbi:hypothetical protein PAE0410 [Pyrobaculum aerophilum str. IM2]|uniref:Uncharacterized protein n=1 Tax=Pyrobaculum aerophilum (strain ATCC 51768 / DSM 7523 / JCM 9630 / CIP 104966 / NBRC 100827 / IM2) TaxID=178306 RepID=Q8ZZ70_PYRAE|nr:hypothetical protein PAE0410 [Pyrobaculum aerophilum str. IM2]